MARIYVASRCYHASMWRHYRDNGAPIISTWLDEAGEGETLDFTDLWHRCVGEATSATALILFAAHGDPLKGALVEVGAALAYRVPVFAVGVDPAHSYLNHSLVTVCESLADAFRLAGWEPFR